MGAVRKRESRLVSARTRVIHTLGMMVLCRAAAGPRLCRATVRTSSGLDHHTNTGQGFYSVFKRGLKNLYRHCSERHLHRYVAEFDLRHTNRVRLGVDDMARTLTALRGIAGKRLTYRDSLPVLPVTA